MPTLGDICIPSINHLHILKHANVPENTKHIIHVMRRVYIMHVMEKPAAYSLFLHRRCSAFWFRSYTYSTVRLCLLPSQGTVMHI